MSSLCVVVNSLASGPAHLSVVNFLFSSELYDLPSVANSFLGFPMKTIWGIWTNSHKKEAGQPQRGQLQSGVVCKHEYRPLDCPPEWARVSVL